MSKYKRIEKMLMNTILCIEFTFMSSKSYRMFRTSIQLHFLVRRLHNIRIVFNANFSIFCIHGLVIGWLNKKLSSNENLLFLCIPFLFIDITLLAMKDTKWSKFYLMQDRMECDLLKTEKGKMEMSDYILFYTQYCRRLIVDL